MECVQCGMGINEKLKPNTTGRSLAYRLKREEREGINPRHKDCVNGTWFYGTNT